MRYQATQGIQCLLSCVLLIGGVESAALAVVEEPAVLAAAEGIKMRALWTLPDALPESESPKAVAIVLPGSGRKVGIDGDVSGPFLGYGYKGASAKLSDQTAAALASVGVASFRYAKRGTDRDEQLRNQTMPYLVADALSATNLAKERFPGAKIFYVGFSEGALVAMKAASVQHVDALFLLGPPTRSIDDIMAYQAVGWPIALMRSRADADRDGLLSGQELASLSELPVLGAPWKTIDSNGDGTLSVEGEVIPAYQNFHAKLRAILASPDYVRWYESLQEFPNFKALAAEIKAPVYIYQALDDAQIPWDWVAADTIHFSTSVTYRSFDGLGHCFSPMEGALGEKKTSGPMDVRVLKALAMDVDGVR